MNRKLLIQGHITLAAFFLAFFLFIPLSGTMYLLGIKGGVEKTEAFTALEPFQNNREFFINQFEKQGIDFNFESIKSNGNIYTLRPSTKKHYQVEVREDVHGSPIATFYSLQPDFINILIEAHKGHGPKIFKKLQTVFGFGFLLTVFGGILLALTVPGYRKVFLFSGAAGVLVLLLALIV